MTYAYNMKPDHDTYAKRYLIIDNGTHYISQLKQFCNTANTDVVSVKDLHIPAAERYSAVVLSGGFHTTVKDGGVYYATEIELIRRGRIPIIGICLGFELIAHSFGASLREMPHYEHGILSITTTKLGKKVFRQDYLTVYENHRFVVAEMSTDFHVLALSKDGIEAFEHAVLPIAGFQFHPEMFLQRTEGYSIFKTILDHYCSRAKS